MSNAFWNRDYKHTVNNVIEEQVIVMVKQNIKYYFVLLVASLMIWGCIEPYDLPNVEQDFIRSLVIDGTLVSDDSVQLIKVSVTRPLNLYRSNGIEPLSGCDVVVTDKDGGLFSFIESEREGYYYCVVPQQRFYEGNIFKLRLTSPDGDIYESEDEGLLPAAPVDSIYFVPIINSDGLETGVEFMVDIRGEQDDARNYKWTIEETYEYHSKYAIQYIYRGDLENPEIREYDKSQYYCYRTSRINNTIYMVSTDKLSENRFVGFPLHTVTHPSGKLKVKYSLLLRQYSLSQNAAGFWSQMKKNQESGGMFDGQPITVEGNLYNVNNTNERVLGYFGVSMVSQKRVFARRTSDFYDFSCSLEIVTDLDSLVDLGKILYVVDESGGGLLTAPAECFDCTLKSGTTQKPVYWDNDDIVTLVEGIE